MVKKIRRTGRIGAVVVLTALLILGLLPEVARSGLLGNQSPSAEAQPVARSQMHVVGVKDTDDGKVSLSLSATSAMKMTRLQINSSTVLTEGEELTVTSLGIGGEASPQDWVVATDTGLTVQPKSEVDVFPGTPVTIEWLKTRAGTPAVEGLDAIAEGIAIANDLAESQMGLDSPHQGELDLTAEKDADLPGQYFAERAVNVSGDSYKRITNSSKHKRCALRKNVFSGKTWWDNSASTLSQGGVDRVDVEITGANNLEAQVNLNDPRLKLRFGSEAKYGWGFVTLEKGADYTAEIVGNVVRFNLTRTHVRAPKVQESYDIEVEIPYTGGRGSTCDVQLYNKELSEPLDPAEGNPTSADNYYNLNFPKAESSCQLTQDRRTKDAKLTMKAKWGWWEEESQQNSFDVIELKDKGAHLPSRIKTLSPEIRLRAQPDASGKNDWQTLRKGIDYSLTFNGESAYIELKSTKHNHDRKKAFNVEVELSAVGHSSACDVALWRKGPKWFNKNASSLEVETSESSREELDWLRPSVANPELPQRCGLDIALVFDTSNSVMNHPKGPSASKEAGLAIIDALQGTGSRMAVYNFASPANRFGEIFAEKQALGKEENIEKLRQAVNAFDWVSPKNQPEKGGTNYQAGLSQIKDGEFDVVYFITDGIPTTNNVDYPGKGLDNGQMTNQSDLDLAIEEANRIKTANTRIETVMVGVDTMNEHILKDGIFNYKRVGGFDSVQKWPLLQGYGYPAFYDPEVPSPLPGHPHRKVPSDSVREMLGLEGRKIFIAESPNANSAYWDVTNQPELWRAGVRSAQSIVEDISGKGAVTRVEDFLGLKEKLRNLVLRNCFGSINVTKLVHDENNQASRGVGWTFETEVDNAGHNAGSVRDGHQLSVFTDITDEQGRFGRTLDQQNQKGQTVKVREHQQEGFRLRSQANGDNASCEAKVYDQDKDEWLTQTIRPRNEGAENMPGFSVDVPFRGIVNCTIENERIQDNLSLSIKKVIYGDETKVLAGSRFSLYKVEGDNKEELQKVDDQNRVIADLERGKRYELVETHAPKGYQLLARPIVFEIASADIGNPEIQLIGGPEQYPEVSVSRDDTDANHLIMQVANISKPGLPRTGGPGLYGLLAIGAALLLAGIMLARRLKA
ncbi:VWA domain-containing protein [Corynebacterium propinquum]